MVSQKLKFLAHPAEECAGRFPGMASVSNDLSLGLFSSVMLASPRATDSSSAEVQLDEGYPGRRWVIGAAGPRLTRVRRGLILKCSLDTGAMPQKSSILDSAAMLPADEVKSRRWWTAPLNIRHDRRTIRLVVGME